jgi:hypothetical protein
MRDRRLEARAAEQSDAADEVRDGETARPSPLIWVFRGHAERLSRET